MGVFHTICTMLAITRKRFGDAGLRDVAVESGVIADGSIAGVLDGRKYNRAIRLFANDVIMIGSVRADWPAPFSVIFGNPRADKLGRNGFECIGRRCLVDRERCVRATFMHSAIENYSMLHLQRWLECRGIKRFGTKSLFMIISHNCQSCMCRQ